MDTPSSGAAAAGSGRGASGTKTRCEAVDARVTSAAARSLRGVYRRAAQPRGASRSGIGKTLALHAERAIRVQRSMRSACSGLSGRGAWVAEARRSPQSSSCGSGLRLLPDGQAGHDRQRDCLATNPAIAPPLLERLARGRDREAAPPRDSAERASHAREEARDAGSRPEPKAPLRTPSRAPPTPRSSVSFPKLQNQPSAPRLCTSRSIGQNAARSLSPNPASAR